MRLLLPILLLGFGLSIQAQPIVTDKNVFEFRGVWVATVENIDWPSKRGLSNEDQKDRCQKLNSYEKVLEKFKNETDYLYWKDYISINEKTILGGS